LKKSIRPSLQGLFIYFYYWIVIGSKLKVSHTHTHTKCIRVMINARRSIKLKAQLVSPNPISRINQFPPISKNNNKNFSSSFDILTHTKMVQTTKVRDHERTLKSTVVFPPRPISFENYIVVSFLKTWKANFQMFKKRSMARESEFPGRDESNSRVLSLFPWKRFNHIDVCVFLF
jgi:hypothetical protein